MTAQWVAMMLLRWAKFWFVATAGVVVGAMLRELI